MDLDKYNIPKDFSALLKSVLCSYGGRYNLFNFDRKISPELFNFLYDNEYMHLFTSYSISEYAPIELLEKLPNKMEWSVILKRKDLTHNFVKKHIKKINIQYLYHQYFPEYDLMVEYINNNESFSDINCMIEKILEANKYTFEQFINLITLVKKKSYTLRKYTSDEFKRIFKLYIKNYYTDSSTNNIIRLKEFLDINTIDYYMSYMIIELLHSQLTPWDIEYLIQNDLVSYYMGSYDISDELFNIFYENRNRLFKIDSNKKQLINPFMCNKYTSFHQIEELIDLSIASGVPNLYVWNYISYNVVDLCNTPKWFWNKHKTSLDWIYVIEKIIETYDDKNILLFMDWIKDHEILIVNEYIPIIPAATILPEVFIAYFATVPDFLINVLKLQKLSLTLLNYLAGNKYLTKDDWIMMSNYQIMDPEFIKKYENKLNWDLLKYNPSFCQYDKNLFHRLPNIDSTNFMAMSIEDKYIMLKSYGINCEIDYKNMNIIMYSKDNISNQLNHYVPNYLKSVNTISKKNSSLKDIFYMNETTNWKIRNMNHMYSCVEQCNYDKVVYNFNPTLMMGNNTTLSQLKLSTALNYQLMSIGSYNCLINSHPIHKFVISYKYLMIIPSRNANGTLMSITFINPIGTVLSSNL